MMSTTADGAPAAPTPGEPSGSEPTGRFDRQVRFAPLGAEGQRRLEEARVLLVGCGARSRLNVEGDAAAFDMDAAARDRDAGPGECRPTGEEICTNELDDDCNGLTDCSDPECTSRRECDFGGCSLELCGNGRDDDCDCLFDCDDPDCAEAASCRISPEVCGARLETLLGASA